MTLIGSICGIACGAEITGRWRKISAIVESIDESEEAEGEVEAEAGGTPSMYADSKDRRSVW